MSVSKKLPGVIDQVAALDSIRARHVDALRVAAGSTVNADERALVEELVAAKFGAFTDKAGRRVVSKFATTLPTAAKLEALGQQKLDITEASGIAPISGGRALVVDDARGVYFVDKNGDTSHILSAEDHPELTDLEGITVNDKETSAFVVAEGTRTVYRIALSKDGTDVKASAPHALGTLPVLNEGTSNGWEGLDIVAGRFLAAPGGPIPNDGLVCVHEAAPTRVLFVQIPDRGQGNKELPVIREFKVPKSAAPHLLDISDVAVDPSNGHLFLLSDRSKSIVELMPKVESQAVGGAMLENIKLELIGITPIPNAKGTKPEGIGFDPDNGQLVIASEKGNKSRIQRFDVKR